MIDITKKYRTRDGREVRIYATDGADPYPVHGAIKNSDGEWCGSAWRRMVGKSWRVERRTDSLTVLRMTSGPPDIRCKGSIS